jgi:aquaporin Z
MNKNLTELIGTFFLVLTIGLTGNPIAIGSMLMIMVYAGGPISGAHYNPAITLAALMRKKIEMGGAVRYWLFQVTGAFLASLVIYLTYNVPMAPPAPAPGFAYNLKPLMMEIIFTFALATVVMNVAMSKKSAGNTYFGIAIGFTVLAAAFAAGPISGGAFNPAVAIGPMLMDTIAGGNSIGNLWIYLAGPFAGAVIAALFYPVLNPDEKEAA